MSIQNATTHWFFSLLFLLGGCRFPVHEAPYRQVNHSVRPGSLLGPFTGEVRDLESKYPVKNASIIVTWEFARRGKTVHTVVRNTVTDDNGNYTIDILKIGPGMAGRGNLTDVNLVIHHPDYLPWSVKTSMPGEFVQVGNMIMLRKLGGLYRTTRKILPLLGTEGLQEKIAEDYYRASMELAGSRSLALNAGGLLMPEHLQNILRRDDVPEVTIIRGDRLDESAYQARFRVDSTRVAWKVWSMLGSQVVDRTREILSGGMNPESVPLGETFDARMYIVSDNDLLVGVTPIATEGKIIMVACSRSICTSMQLLQLMQMAVSRRQYAMFMEAGFHD